MKESSNQSANDGANPQKPVIFFDGVCGLCNWFVDWTMARDPNAKFLFSPLQGTTAERLLTEADRLDLASVVVLTPRGLLRRSSAVVFVMKELGGKWSALGTLLWVIPSPLRDFGYALVAKLRYRLFGTKETCRIPSPTERKRFLP